MAGIGAGQPVGDTVRHLGDLDRADACDAGVDKGPAHADAADPLGRHPFTGGGSSDTVSHMSRVGTRAVIAAMVVALAACGGLDDGTGADGDFAVVATTTQVGAIVEEIGGEDVKLTVLLEPGIEAHDFEMSPAAGAAVEEADLILKSGAGLESWLDDALETIGGTERVRDLSEGIALRSAFAEAGHEEDGHDEDVDPHYWLSVPNAIAMVENARAALTDAAPEAASDIDERSDTLIRRLESADAEIRALIDEIPPEQRAVVTDHDALGYFLDEYGLRFIGSIFSSLDVSAEPGAQEIEALVSDIRNEGVRAIFVESALNPRLARAVADETDATLVAEPLYTDSLGPEGSGADTLDGMLLHNARILHDGLLGG